MGTASSSPVKRDQQQRRITKTVSSAELSLGSINYRVNITLLWRLIKQASDFKENFFIMPMNYIANINEYRNNTHKGTCLTLVHNLVTNFQFILYFKTEFRQGNPISERKFEVYFVDLGSNIILQDIIENSFILWNMEELFGFKMFCERVREDHIFEEIDEVCMNKSTLTIHELHKLYDILSTDVEDLLEDEIQTNTELIMETISSFVDELFPHPISIKKAIL